MRPSKPISSSCCRAPRRPISWCAACRTSMPRAELRPRTRAPTANSSRFPMATEAATASVSEGEVGRGRGRGPAPRPRAVRGRQGGRSLLFLALYSGPLLAVYGLFILWPLLSLALLSLQRWDGYSTPVFVGLDNYGALWSDPGFALELEHSLIWLGVTLLAPPLLGLVLALLSAVTRWPRAVARGILLAPLLLPSVVIAVIWKLVYNPLSGPLSTTLRDAGLGMLAGDWLGDPHLALPALLVPASWASFGLSLLTFSAALSAIDPAMLAAAQVDGAGAWARLRLITLPNLRGAAPLAVVATALSAVPALDLVLLMTNGGPGYATTIVPLDMYGRAFGGGQVGSGAALGCVQALVGLLLAAAALALVSRYSHAGAEQAGATGDEGLRVRPGRAVRLPAGAALLAATAAVAFPIVWLLVLGLQAAPGQAATSPWDALSQNTSAVWANGFGGAFVTSLWVGVVVAAATLALSIPAAFALAGSAPTAPRVLILALLALGLFQPGAVLIIPLFTLLKEFGLLNSYLGLIVPEVARALPVAGLLLWLALRGLPADVLAAARVDGAAPRQVLLRVAIPLSLPMIAVAGLWAFLSSWNEFMLPTVVLQDETLQTVPTVVAHFVGRVDTQYALVATGALLAIAPLLLLYGALYGLLAGGLCGVRARL